MDEEDVRYDVFNSIYNMLHDNIQLRMKNNKLSKRILSQSELILDKSVTQSYTFDKNNLPFKEKIQELTEQFELLKDKAAGTPGATPATPGILPKNPQSNYSGKASSISDIMASKSYADDSLVSDIEFKEGAYILMSREQRGQIASQSLHDHMSKVMNNQDASRQKSQK